MSESEPIAHARLGGLLDRVVGELEKVQYDFGRHVYEADSIAKGYPFTGMIHKCYPAARVYLDEIIAPAQALVVIVSYLPDEPGVEDRIAYLYDTIQGLFVQKERVAFGYHHFDGKPYRTLEITAAYDLQQGGGSLGTS